MVRRSPERKDWQGLDELRREVERLLGRTCRDRNELEDLVQETLLRAASFRPGLTDPERLSCWVRRIATNVMRDHVRRKRGQRAVVPAELLLELESDEPQPLLSRHLDDFEIGGAPYDGEELLGLLQDLLAGLSGQEKHLFRAFYTEGLGCLITAQQLNVTTQTVKMRLYRLRRKLRWQLKKHALLFLRPCHGPLEVVA